MKKITLLTAIIVCLTSCKVSKREYIYYTYEAVTHKDGTVHRRIDTNTDGYIVILPEEYQEITKKDNLRGYWKNGVLYIEFDNTNP